MWQRVPAYAALLMKEVCCRVTLAAWKAEVGNGGSVVKNPSEIQEPLDLWV